MTSFIIIAANQEKRATYIQNYCQTLAINAFDRTIVQRQEKGKQSIGIDDIKAIHSNIFLKPMKGKTKAVVIEEAHLLTTEAQNALLKLLEEPPDHTIILMSADSKEALLATILSRCQVIELPTEQLVLSKEEKKEYEEFISQLSNLGVGERLKKAELLAKDKEKTLVWLENLILVLREKILEQPDNISYLRSLKSFQKLHTLLKTTNVNPRLAIENTLLSVSTSN